MIDLIDMTYDFPFHFSGDTWDGINSITIQSMGSAVNLSACQVYIQIRSIHNVASPVVFEFSTLEGELSSDGKINIMSPVSSGKINIPSQIVDIPVGTYNYDLKIFYPNGNKKTYLTGKWEILPSITR